ncbi:MAG: lipopolysaccharide heptosyltransferase II [Cellvibrionales bacterium]|jgi:heptosyltransferase-2|nr:lipopolysaccharide heptosyltransferase II [Cellvibrionales bacterium]MBK8675050.1 lipopolysaccharide heptosyltransferase II [Cellvibrionales bacterium]
MLNDTEKDVSAILVVGPAWVGDMVMAQVLFRLLKQQNPQCDIDVLAPAWSAPLLARMPEVRASFDLPLKHGEFSFSVRRNLGHALRGKYQQAILLPNSWKSALVPFFANIPRRTGWRGEMRYGVLNDVRVLDKQKYPLMIERFAALAFAENEKLPTSLPYPQLLIDDSEQQQALQKYALDLQKPVLALCPGAEFGPAKRWPEQHYASVASERIAAGDQVWVFGSQNDAEVAEAIRSALPSHQREFCLNLAGKTALAEAIDLLSCANAVVSNDSGLMHIAAALQRPLVAVYGSSSPQFTPPLSSDVEIVRSGIECSPCFQRECPLGHLKCLRDLSPQRVLDALDKLPKPVVIAA